jgi:hypothetical protein
VECVTFRWGWVQIQSQLLFKKIEKKEREKSFFYLYSLMDVAGIASGKIYESKVLMQATFAATKR